MTGRQEQLPSEIAPLRREQSAQVLARLGDFSLQELTVGVVGLQAQVRGVA